MFCFLSTFIIFIFCKDVQKPYLHNLKINWASCYKDRTRRMLATTEKNNKMIRKDENGRRKELWERRVKESSEGQGKSHSYSSDDQGTSSNIK